MKGTSALTQKKVTSTATSIVPTINATTLQVNGQSLADAITAVIAENTSQDAILNTITSSYQPLLTTSSNLTLNNITANAATLSAVSSYATDLSASITNVKHIPTKGYTDTAIAASHTAARTTANAWSAAQSFKSPILQDASGSTGVSFDSSNNVLISKKMVASAGIDSVQSVKSWVSLETWQNSLGLTMQPNAALDSGAPLVSSGDSVVRARGGSALCLTLDSSRIAGLRLTNATTSMQSGNVSVVADGSNNLLYITSPTTTLSGSLYTPKLGIWAATGLSSEPSLSIDDTVTTNRLGFCTAAQAGNYNEITHNNDVLIFGHTTGGLTLTTHSVNRVGLRLDTSGNAILSGGTRDISVSNSGIVFSENPQVSTYVTPSTNTALVPKQYVDSLASSLSTTLSRCAFEYSAYTIPSGHITYPYRLIVPKMSNDTTYRANSDGWPQSFRVKTNMDTTTGIRRVTLQVSTYYNVQNAISSSGVYSWPAVQATTTAIDMCRATAFSPSEYAAMGSMKHNIVATYGITVSGTTVNIQEIVSNISMITSSTQTLKQFFNNFNNNKTAYFNPFWAGGGANDSNGSSFAVTLSFPNQLNSPLGGFGWCNRYGGSVQIIDGFDSTRVSGWTIEPI